MSQKLSRALWSPKSYLTYRQYFDYFPHSNPVFKKLSQFPPIVPIQRINQARYKIELCQIGKATLLHVGDCAEHFQDATESVTKKKIKFMKDCKQTLQAVKKRPVQIVGRIAGQYAKPRSTQFIEIKGVKMHNYKGDNVNSFDETDRNPNVQRLLQGYHHSLNTARQIQKDFPSMLTSHEGLIIPYQQAQTKKVNEDYYCQSAHMIWIGERTRQLDSAHVQFLRGIRNPIGVKISDKVNIKDFIDLVKVLNPENERGKLLVIVRMGKDKIKTKLDDLISAKINEGLNFLFVTDPMHANTFESSFSKLKTRNVNHILEQINYFEQKMSDSKLARGYSLESTYEDVTECFGLQFPRQQKQVSKQKFVSKCDPRLNREQTLKVLSLLSAS